MIKVVTIDCWDTILENTQVWDPVLIELAHRVFASTNGCWSMESSRAAFYQEAQEFTQILKTQLVTVSASQRIRNLCNAAGIVLSESAFGDLEKSVESSIFHPVPQLVKGADSFLARVRSTGRKVGIVCNTGWFSSRAITNVLKYYQLDKKIQFAVYSDQVGSAKPSSKIFEAARDISGCAASETVHVGDNLRNDIMGAINAGQYAIHLHPDGACVGQTFWCAKDYDEVWRILTSHLDVFERI
jgi:FMN phosphatase YigB (HAD superfamily)